MAQRVTYTPGATGVLCFLSLMFGFLLAKVMG